ncbi:hypothetical protein ACQ4PT_000181 [Festuca glaucescens]
MDGLDLDGCLWALEASGDFLAAVVDEEAEVDGHVEVDAQDVGLESGAEADGGLQVGEALDQGAARLLRWLSELQVDQPVQHVGAHAQLQRVDRAPPSTSAAAASSSRSAASATTAASTSATPSSAAPPTASAPTTSAWSSTTASPTSPAASARTRAGSTLAATGVGEGEE